MTRLVLHHINKCAGSTLLEYLPQKYAASKILKVENFVGAGRDLSRIPHDLVSRAGFIHDPYGVTDWKTKQGAITTLAFFRDPIARLISEWQMICAWSDDAIATSEELARSRAAARAGFRSFLLSSEPELMQRRWNLMATHLLLGDEDLCERTNAFEFLYNPDFPRLVRERALDNLARIDLIGLTERFDESLLLLCLAMEWPDPRPLQNHNVRDTARLRQEIDASTLQLAEACTAIDREIHGEACRMFEARLASLGRPTQAQLRELVDHAARERGGRQSRWRLHAMDEPFVGTGWQAREINGFKFSSWMGPAPRATLELAIDKSADLLLRLRCTNWMGLELLEKLTVSADGARLATDIWSHPSGCYYVDCVAPQRSLDAAHPLLKLELDCGSVASADGDPRSLGLEFCEIEAGPRGLFMARQLGTP
jgi:hypothetical protein